MKQCKLNSPVLNFSYIGTKFVDKNPSVMLSFDEARPKKNDKKQQ